MPLTARQKFGSLAWHYRIEAFDGANVVTVQPTTRMAWRDLKTAAHAAIGAGFTRVWVFMGYSGGGPHYIALSDGALTETTAAERDEYWQLVARRDDAQEARTT